MLKSGFLKPLLRPKSIAVIGGREAAAVIEQCLAIGYRGKLWPVHPIRDTIHGQKVYRTIEALPSAPDAAFIAVNRDSTVEAVRALRKKGAGGAICYASGFSEADGKGKTLQSELVKAAGDMPIIGPNCYGLLNYADGITLWPDQHGGQKLKPGTSGVAIITQSSNIAVNISMQQRGLPIAYILTAGNQAQTGLSQLALELLEDERVTALGLHIEGFDSIKGMEEVAHRARQLRKPVVALKMGRSAKARHAAFTHTASISGPDAPADAFLQRSGIARLNSLPSFLEALKLLHVHGPLEGYDISSMSCSGGEASLIADAAVGRNINFRDLTKAQKQPLADILGTRVTLANPLDYHTYIWGNGEDTEAVFTAMLSAGFDLNCLILDYPRNDRCNTDDWQIPTRALANAATKTGAKAAIVSTLHENIPEQQAQNLIANSIAPMLGIDETLDAIEAAAIIGRAWQQPFPKPLAACADTGSSDGYLPDEAQAKQILAGFDIPVPRGFKCNNRDGIAIAAKILGFPIVLKALGIAHKSEHNAVRLNLQTANEVNLAATELRKISSEIYVEQMIENSVFELLIGLVTDAQFGLVMTLATGGTMVEIFDDAQTVLLPTSEAAVEQALRNLKSAVFYDGFRGGAKADFTATVAAIMAVQEFGLQNCDNLLELDINPLMVCPAGKGVVAADALIRFRRNMDG